MPEETSWQPEKIGPDEGATLVHHALIMSPFKFFSD